MQRILVDDVLKALVSIETPSTIVGLPYSWEEACEHCVVGEDGSRNLDPGLAYRSVVKTQLSYRAASASTH